MSPPVAAAEPPAIHSSDLISSLPAPVLRLLVLFSRPISYLKVCIEVLSWKSGRRVESWCVVVVWWLVCLGSDHAFRWLLPALLFLPLAPLSKLRLGSHTAPPKPSAAHPATQDILLHTLSDLHAIHALVPPSPIPTISSVFSRFSLLGPVRLTRGLLIIWATWIVLGRVVGFRSLLALMGSMILMYPSPALAHLYDTLSKSLVVRRSIALIFILVFGSPPDQKHTMSFSFSPAQWIKSKWAVSRRPSLALSFRPATSSTNNHANASESAIVDDDDSDELGPGSKVSEPIYFRFEVHENQRWWMGLDWTSALLPQERPSWCDSHLLPVLPPASYPLPPSATIILPHSTKSDPDGRVKRVANWRWLDDDWTIVRTGPNNPTSIPASTSSGFLANAASAASPSIPEDEGYSLRGVSASPATTHSAHMEESASTVGTRAQSIAEQAFAKGLERLKARTGTAVPATKTGAAGTAAAASPARNSGEFKRGRTGSQASEDAREIDGTGVPPAPATLSTAPMETIVERDEATDAEGWVYGDNKWDSVGPRGGLGKFTRRRRWHRRAILTETVYRIPSSPQEADATSANDDDKTPHPITPVKSVFANEKAGNLDSIDRDLDVNLPAKMEKRMSFNGQDSDKSTSRDGNARGSLDVSRGTAVGSIIPPASPTARDDVLRQRLKKAMGSAGG